MSLICLPTDRHGLLPIAGTDDPGRTMDLVFIHGLGGDAFTSWMADPQRIETFWPYWLAQDRPHVGIWTLGYAADPSGWQAQSMPLADRGTQVLDLLASAGLGERPLVFITHSMGGIVAKQLLRHADGFGVARWQRIARETRGIAFIATPHTGANLTNFGQFASAVFRTNEQVQELAAHDARLRELHHWFRGFYTEHWLICRTWCERREVRPELPWLGIKLPKGIVVVDATSAEPNLPGEVAVPLDEDHLSICKPAARNAQLYQSLRRWLEECEAAAEPPATAVPSVMHTTRGMPPADDWPGASAVDFSLRPQTLDVFGPTRGGPAPVNTEAASVTALSEEAIRLDVAAPAGAIVNEPFDLAVTVRQPDAAPVPIDDLPNVASAPGKVYRPGNEAAIRYRIEVSGPAGCLVTPTQYTILLKRRENADPKYFRVTFQHAGAHTLFVNAYQADGALAAQTRIRIAVSIGVQGSGMGGGVA